MKKINLIKRLWTDSREKQSPQRFGRYAAMLIMLLTLGVGQLWAAKSIWEWKLYYWDGDSNEWLGGDNNTGDLDFGVVDAGWYWKGAWAKTADNNSNSVTVYYVEPDGTEDNFGLTYQNCWGDNCWNKWWKKEDGCNIQLASSTVYKNNPGVNTIQFYVQIDGENKLTPKATYTLPGFTTTSTSQAFSNTTVGGESTTTKISFGKHYGTALTTSNCSSLTDFTVTAIDEDGVTVKFTPQTAGSKSETLTITDAHNKTCSISLTGTTRYAVSYQKGSTSGATGSTITDYKVYGSNLTLRSSGGFSRTGFTHSAWNTNSAGTGGTSYSFGATYSTEAVLTLYPTWNEIRYSVTFATNNSSMGTLKIDDVSKSFGSAYTIGVTNKITVTPNPGYYFTGWSSMPSGMHKVTDNTTTSGGDAYFYADDTGKTITANFAPIWAICGSQADNTASGTDGFGGWSTSNNNCEIENINISAGVTTGFIDITLEANKDYEFKMRNRADNSGSGAWYGNGGDKVYKMTYSGSHSDWAFATDKSYNCGITTAGAGTYRFTWNLTNKTLTVTYPDSYTVTYSYDTGGSSVSASVSGGAGALTSGKYAAGGADVEMTATPATGYEFTKWVDGSDADVSTSNPYTIVDIGANTTIKAVFTPLTYKITFNPNGGSISNNGSTCEESSERKINATYDAAVSGTMPTAVKNGRHFVGWYTASDEGYKVINADGTWNQVTGYTDASKHWVRAENTTLYAHYEDPTFLSVDFSPKYAMPESDITATVSFNSAIGDPEGFYTLCCKLSTKSGTVLQAQPTITHDGVNPFVFTFTAPSSPGEYALQVKLFPGTDNVCGGNSPIAIIEGGDLNYFDVEEMNPITITYECGGVELRESTTIYATWNNRATVTAPTIAGMKFDHWEYANCTIEGGAAGRYNSAEATFYAFTTGSAKAVYTQGSLFFKNTLNWDHVYVYFYSANKWTTLANNPEGTGSNGANFISGPHEMSLLDGTDDVYYFDEATHGTMPTFAAVAFSKESMANYDYFAGSKDVPTNVVYVNTFDKTNKPMIVPLGTGATWNYDKCRYYAHDLAPLLQDWGATVRSDIDGWVATHKLKSEKMGDLSFSTKIYFDRKSYNQNWRVYDGSATPQPYGKAGTPTLTYSSPTSATLVHNEGNLLVKTSLPGEYIFTINYDYTLGTGAYDGATATTGLWKCAKVTVTYPIKVGDYRLVYDDSNLNPHPSDIIKKENNCETIVSMFYNPNATPVLKIQSCTAVATNLADDADPITWSSPTTINLSSYSFVLTEAGVYNFTIRLNETGTSPTVSNVEKYSGRFYVRTNCVNSDKWNYKDSKDAHAMTYSDYSTTLTKKPYSHYYVKDIHGESSSVNIRFTVATDYSEAVTDTVFAGDVSGDYQDYFGSETLHLTQNVRFTYNQKTNKIWRAYTEGPTNNDYMVLRSGSGLYATKDAPSPTTTFKFTDMGNWVYQVDVYSLVNTRVKLTADIHKHTAADNNDSDAADNVRQYLKGKEGNGTDGTEWTGDDAVLLLGGSGESKEHMRITYDFKTDRMTTAWLPSGTVSTDLSIDADVMMLRREQEGATSIVIGTKGEGVYATLSNVEKAYGVMEFRKSYINDISLSRFERNLYWISFPFDVKLSDVFGFGKYGQHWIIEYYDGKGRAQKGYWADSEPNWKYVSEEVKDEFTLNANEGYILALALSNMSNSSSIWTSGSESLSSVYLYFPSSSNIGNITNITSYEMPLDSVGYKCKITRDHRDVKDSYWHCIGVPSYGLNRLTGVSTTVPGNGEDWSTPLPYVYKWDSIYNKLEIASSSTFTFQAMKSYLIQYANDKIEWTNVTNKPKTIVSRNRVEGENADFYEWRLNLIKDNKRLDHTYIRLSEDENATDGYDFGNDLSKEFNSGANIFTYVDGIEVAGNVMPVVYGQTRTVPVGVKITESGDYTFSIPEGANGTGVVLIDNIAGTRTNLALEDYTVNLTAGTFNERFFLEISPIVQSPTDIEQTSSDSKDGVRKVMVDGILYIVKDGKVFDAQGNRIK